MGAKVHYESSQDMAPVSDTAPFSITGGDLTGMDFALKVASAQVQTAILLAGLQAQGKTSVSMPALVRDHTERMFAHIGVPFSRDDNGRIEVTGLGKPLAPFNVTVPGDLSSAAFFIVAAACLPGSDLLLMNVGLNPGRKLVIDALQRMGADIKFEDVREAHCEPVADIRVRYKGRLKGVTVSGEEVASGIDEIPILALAGCTCEGAFVVRDAGELRHKESDRLKAMVENIQDMGITVESLDDGFIIDGAKVLPGASLWRTYNDHRLAMTGLIANCLTQEPLQIEETDSIKISYPRFEEQLAILAGG
jgi:3-phosphoshikimate 1-carboxyvinyltransferase